MMKLKKETLADALMDYRVLGWLLALVALVIAFFPQGKTFQSKYHIDKISHFFFFYLFVIFLCEGYGEKKKGRILFLGILLGIAIELVQKALPWREASFGDLIANILGIFSAALTPQSFRRKIPWMLATVFYIGKTKYFPGTIVSFFSLLIYYLLPVEKSFLYFAVPPIVVISIWVSRSLEGKKDDHSIVLDELVGSLFAVLFHPKDLRLFFFAFIFFRFFDIIKPFYIRKLESLPHGAGVVADDIGAGILANISIFLLVFLKKKFFVQFV